MPHFLKFENSYLCSQKPATWIQSTPTHPIYLSTILILSCHLCPGLNKWSLCYRFPHQNSLCISFLPICSTWPAHLITRIIQHTIHSEYSVFLSAYKWNIITFGHNCWYFSCEYENSSLVVKKENKVRTLVNRVLRRIFVPKWEEVAVEWRQNA